ncbi:hypothetical protein NPIL_616691 [Nephila pilipes]|uniref:Uncharacterized protein n=1 Tax=Nephila pilipes TaxID=299642 RepID=A0A8X6TW29_NEPPI|nr:hypothetical protein NPIL_616691 [Nephila pilipes]
MKIESLNFEVRISDKKIVLLTVHKEGTRRELANDLTSFCTPVKSLRPALDADRCFLLNGTPFAVQRTVPEYSPNSSNIHITPIRRFRAPINLSSAIRRASNNIKSLISTGGIYT